MMLPVIQAEGTEPPSRNLLRSLMTAVADILPGPDTGILRAHVPGVANDASDRRTDALPGEADTTETVFAGTALRLVHEVGKGTGPARTACFSLRRSGLFRALSGRIAPDRFDVVQGRVS